jgi:hypothetical protein
MRYFTDISICVYTKTLNFLYLSQHGTIKAFHSIAFSAIFTSFLLLDNSNQQFKLFSYFIFVFSSLTLLSLHGKLFILLRRLSSLHLKPLTQKKTVNIEDSDSFFHVDSRLIINIASFFYFLIH